MLHNHVKGSKHTLCWCVFEHGAVCDYYYYKGCLVYIRSTIKIKLEFLRKYFVTLPFTKIVKYYMVEHLLRVIFS